MPSLIVDEMAKGDDELAMRALAADIADEAPDKLEAVTATLTVFSTSAELRTA